MGTSEQNAGGCNLRWNSIPSRGSSNTPSRLHATETGKRSGSVGQFGPSAAFIPSLVPVNIDRGLLSLRAFKSKI